MDIVARYSVNLSEGELDELTVLADAKLDTIANVITDYVQDGFMPQDINLPLAERVIVLGITNLESHPDVGTVSTVLDGGRLMIAKTTSSESYMESLDD